MIKSQRELQPPINMSQNSLCSSPKKLKSSKSFNLCYTAVWYIICIQVQTHTHEVHNHFEKITARNYKFLLMTSDRVKILEYFNYTHCGSLWYWHLNQDILAWICTSLHMAFARSTTDWFHGKTLVILQSMLRIPNYTQPLYLMICMAYGRKEDVTDQHDKCMITALDYLS